MKVRISVPRTLWLRARCLLHRRVEEEAVSDGLTHLKNHRYFLGRNRVFQYHTLAATEPKAQNG